MSSSERRIRAAAKQLGFEIEDIHWEPISIALEMCGHSGGWVINGGQILGYNWIEVVREMKRIKDDQIQESTRPAPAGH